ncbi:MAG TPA: DUF4403 family protein [Panacibacter sp.]|nr:DUF4403 family protein [Panacibacter sp.]HNP42880.1 DUF4403 family protein [Panacibacter sp.]
MIKFKDSNSGSMKKPLNAIPFFLSITLVVVAGCNGCFQKDISAVAPDPVTDIVNVDLPESSFNFPVTYAISKLAALVNHKISGKFFETTVNPLGNEKDEALLSFTKIKPITIRVARDQLICRVTLQVNGSLLKSRYGKFLTRQVKPLETEVSLELATPVSLGSDWSLQTKFALKSFDWLTAPILQVGPIKADIRDILEDALNKNDARLTRMLDDELSKAVSLKPAISKVWFDLQKPIVIHKNVPVAWMKFTCDSVKGKIMLEKDVVKCYTNVTAKMMMFTDTGTLPAAKPLPPYRLLTAPGDESDIYLYAFTSFDEINEQVNSRLAGKVVSARGYTIVIDSMRAYASAAGISVKITTSKDVEGTVVASGKLEFDTKTQQIALRNFDYALNSNSTIINAADQFLHSVVKDSIGPKLVLGLDTLIQRVPDLVENAIAKGKTGNAIDLTLDNLVINDCKISMGAERVHFRIHAGAQAGIALKKINAGGRLTISAKPKNK